MVGVVVYPAWGLFCAWVEPGSAIDWPGRLAVAAMFAVLAASSWIRPMGAREAEERLALACTVLTAHYYQLLWLNHASTFYLAGVFVTLAALDASFTRLGLLASNIANAATPGYKARDIDFGAALKARLNGASESQAEAGATLYRVPVMPSLDGNTVEMATEQTAFAENAVGYSATLEFIKGRVGEVTRALKGD